MRSFEETATGVRLLFLDVDGVLTDGLIRLTARGEEFKSFHVRDGLGLKMLISGGVEPVFISGRRLGPLTARARELGVTECHEKVKEKGILCRSLRELRGLEKSATACIGDDLPDLSMFEEVGVRIAVSDAAKELRDEADYVTKNPGGKGAVREVCEKILKSQGKWSDIWMLFAGK